ncbi:transposable element Tcb2 transposase [Trichonephila clavipes]|nr:transposable element Tcb2 transposase [Trichonephila clavipes]
MQVDANVRRSTPAPHGCIPEDIFQQDNVLPDVAKTVGNFCSAQHMQLLPWTAFSPDMLPIEHVFYLVCRRLARDLCPAASKHKRLLRIQMIRILFHKQIFVMCLTPDTSYSRIYSSAWWIHKILI